MPVKRKPRRYWYRLFVDECPVVDVTSRTASASMAGVPKITASVTFNSATRSATTGARCDMGELLLRVVVLLLAAPYGAVQGWILSQEVTW